MNILSLGGGIQSSALLLMSEAGVLPRLDAAIFADTGWEPKRVYQNVAWLKETCRTPVHIVKGRRGLREDVMSFARGDDGNRGYRIPAFTLTLKTGEVGMLKRQCTRDYKLRIVERCIRRELLGLPKGARVPPGTKVVQWIGISSDEVRRVRQSDTNWVDLHYPLCNLPTDYFSQPKTRLACIDWLAEHFPDREFPRSACIGCPYHTNDEWARIKQDPEEWADAVEVDEAIRNVLVDGPQHAEAQIFLHASAKPLAIADLSTPISFEFGRCMGSCLT